MEKICITLLFTFVLQFSVQAQELPLILDKQGTFEILRRTDFTDYKCGFTKSEIADNLREIESLVGVMRKNPILSEMKGFDGRARIYSMNCNDFGAYGIPSQITFEFASWFMNSNGTPARILMEPPSWSIIINKQKPSTAWPFSAGEFLGDKNLFIVPAKKEAILPGIDLYDGEIYVIYNPDRPPYWLPVSVREAFTRQIAYWKSYPDKVAAETMVKLVESEYAAVSAEQMDKPAHTGGGGIISRIGTDTGSPPILRVNPEYWNRSLSKSAIQFLYLRMVNNKPFLKARTAENLKNNRTSYHLALFEESLDMNMVRSLLPLIGN
jgi:hypothetical protein